MASIVVTTGAQSDLRALIETRNLPDDTRSRVQSHLATLEKYPNSGRPLNGKWHDHRLLVGPWDWMLTVYWYDAPSDVVIVAAFEDSRQASAATSVG